MNHTLLLFLCFSFSWIFRFHSVIYRAGIIFGWLGAYAIDRYGRRILLVISSSGVMVGMLLLSLHFLLLDFDYDPGDLEWLPILSLLIFMLMCFGLVPVPSTMLSELFPSDLKSAAGFIASITSAIFAFASTKSYQPLADIMGDEYIFFIYVTIMIACVIYSLTLVPETKGKTLQVNMSACDIITILFAYIQIAK